jgi:putative DNA primase/helicase
MTMIRKKVKDIVMEYVKNIVIIDECPASLYKLTTLVSLIKERGDEKACGELKYHCDIIDENLFSSIVGTLIEGVTINYEKLSQSDIEIIHDEILVNELKALIKHNKATSIGFFYDDKNKLKLNTNRCISYLQQVLECVVKNGSLMVLNQKEGIYEELNEELIGTILRYLMNNAIPDSWKKYYEKDILDGLIREIPRLDGDIVDDSLIALNNGVYNLKTKELVPYNKNHLFMSKSPVNFVKGAVCPKFIKAIREIACNDEELLMCIQEIFGYVLINNTKGERAFYFVGVGSNGKSFCAEILTNLVGRKNVSNIPLSKFSEKFGIEGIVDKSLNIANENELGGAISTESLKALISGDPINISRKFKKAINVKSNIKLIFLLNTLPDTLDNTHGIIERYL